jgi:hypothetical protein
LISFIDSGGLSALIADISKYGTAFFNMLHKKLKKKEHYRNKKKMLIVIYFKHCNMTVNIASAYNCRDGRIQSNPTNPLGPDIV